MQKYFILSWTILTLFSCSVPQKYELDPQETKFSLLIRPKWFTYRKDRAQRNAEGEVEGHPFFDFNPYLNLKNRTLNFYVVTPEDSPVYFSFDMLTGRRYRKHNLCGMEDAWKKNGFTMLPPYTEGIVPRTLDRLGQPQKIMVFGKEESFSRFPGLYAHRARVIGGIVQDYCPSGSCLGSNDWQSRVVLVGVNPAYKKYEDVYSLDQLKEKIRWSKVEAFSNNGPGASYRFIKQYPVQRLKAYLDSQKAMKLVTNKLRNFELKDIEGLQKSCHKLYDKVVRDLGPKAKNQNYYTRFKSLHKRFYQQLQTCLKYVKGSSINNDFKNHWFMTYYQAFYHLHSLGAIYQCEYQSWALRERSVLESVNVRNYLLNCSDEDLDRAFDTAIFYLFKQYKTYNPSYHYVEYDSLKGGSHDKVHSWVYNDGNYQKCQNNDRKSNLSFPSDIKWLTRIEKKNDLKL